MANYEIKCSCANGSGQLQKVQLMLKPVKLCATAESACIVCVCERERSIQGKESETKREDVCVCERRERVREKEKCDLTQIIGLGAKSETVHTTASNNLLQYLM